MPDTNDLEANQSKVKASDNEDYLQYTIISIIIPLVGFILGIVYLTKDAKVDKKLGEHLLAISVLMSLLACLGYYLLFMSGAYSVTTYMPAYQ